MAEEPLSTSQFIEATGATFRVLDYWVRTGVIDPAVEAAGSGSRRQFHAADVPRVRTLVLISAALSRASAGVSTVLLGEIFDAMRNGDNVLDLGHGICISWEQA